MNTWQRFLIILQLCFTFSVFLWYFTQPFMGEYFSLRSRMLLYEYAMGNGNSDFQKKQSLQGEKLSRNAQRFENLNLAQQNAIKKGYQALQSYSQRSPWTKVLDGAKVIFLYIPPFKLAWLFFATAVGILLLLNRPGARQAVWLLPLIALIYAIDNQYTGHRPIIEKDTVLFPTEQLIVKEYLQDQNFKIINQDELQKGWNNYLVANWSSKDSTSNSNLLENAEFNFTVARLMLLYEEHPHQWLDAFNEKNSYLLLCVYFFWNLCFAICLSESKKKYA
jgi:hypothetical protein